MRNSLVVLLLVSCSSAQQVPTLQVGARALKVRSAAWDATGEGDRAVVFVVAGDSPDACAVMTGADCAVLTRDQPPFDTLAILASGQAPGSWRPGLGSRVLLGFADEPGRRDVADGKIALTEVRDDAGADRLGLSVSMVSLRGETVKGDAVARHCPGLIEHVLRCQGAGSPPATVDAGSPP